jgi:hypothetical protein
MFLDIHFGAFKWHLNVWASQLWTFLISATDLELTELLFLYVFCVCVCVRVLGGSMGGLTCILYLHGNFFI